MRRVDRWPVLPHEIVFGTFVLATLVRLIAAQGFLAPLSLLYGGMFLVMAAAVVWCRRHETKVRWRLRLGLYPVLVGFSYFSLGGAVPVFEPGKVDAWLQSFDFRLIGGNASLALEPWAHPIFTEILSACYILFFPCVLVSWIYYFRGSLPTLRRFVTGMFTVYAVGFLGYSFLPALGPYLDPALALQFKGPLTGGWIARFDADLVLWGSNRVDAFPSLHCAITAYILAFDRVHAPHRFRLWLLPVIGLWIATVYLRYHYMVDVLAGFALAAGAYGMVRQATTASYYDLSGAMERSRSRSNWSQ